MAAELSETAVLTQRKTSGAWPLQSPASDDIVSINANRNEITADMLEMAQSLKSLHKDVQAKLEKDNKVCDSSILHATI